MLNDTFIFKYVIMNYQKKIYDKYRDLLKTRIDDNYCNKKKEIEMQQRIVSREIQQLDYMIIYHNTGSGKTCASLQIANRLRLNYEIYFIMPRAIIPNFYNELNSFCGNKQNSYYVYTYLKFIKNFKYNKNKKYLLIIDEVHNILSSDGKIYNSLLNIIDKIDKCKIVLMTATPVIDDIDQLRLLTNIITKKELRLNRYEYLNRYYTRNNLNSNFSKMYGKYISYYPGAPSSAYPKLKIKYIDVKLNKIQINAIKNDKTYITLKNNVNNNTNVISPMSSFYIKLRLYSNIYISKSLNESIKNGYCEKFINMYTNFNLNNKIFVYSSFTNNYGIAGIIAYLEYKKIWKYYFDCTKEELKDKSIYKYIIWSGDISEKIKLKGLKIFNSNENLYGNIIKLIIGSPASKEGVSFEAVTQVHILEPYWNWSRIYQIYSRAVRFCRHEKLKLSERIVQVFIYIGIGNNDFVSVDKYVLNLLRNKQKLINKIELGLQKYSFDYLLYKS